MVGRKGNAGREAVTVVGIVIPIAWDEDGNPLATTISTPGELEYLVEQDTTGRELLALVRQEIEVVGILHRKALGENTIRVSNYRLKGAREWKGKSAEEKTTPGFL